MAGIAATLVNDGVIDDLVQFGSPGSGVQDVGEFHVPEGHTYVSAACAPFFGGSMSHIRDTYNKYLLPLGFKLSE